MEKSTPARVLVVGAGVAGLQTLRALLRAGFDAVCLESSIDVGGVWCKNYQGYGLQVPYDLYTFHEYPYPPHVQHSEFPSGRQVQNYIKAYVEHFNLQPHIRLMCKLIKLMQHNGDATATTTATGKAAAAATDHPAASGTWGKPGEATASSVAPVDTTHLSPEQPPAPAQELEDDLLSSEHVIISECNDATDDQISHYDSPQANASIRPMPMPMQPARAQPSMFLMGDHAPTTMVDAAMAMACSSRTEEVTIGGGALPLLTGVPGAAAPEAPSAPSTADATPTAGKPSEQRAGGPAHGTGQPSKATAGGGADGRSSTHGGASGHAPSCSCGGWTAFYQDLASGQVYGLDVDFVVLATGMFSTPFIPPLPGQSLFLGTQIHSKNFVDVAIARGRDCVVLGAGKTALDCLSEVVITRAAKSVTLVYRQPHWPIPRTLGKTKLPYKLYSRATLAMLPPYYNDGPLAALRHVLAAPAKRLFWWHLSRRVERAMMVERTMGKPSRPLEQDLFHGGHVLDTIWPLLMSDTRVRTKRGTVVSLSPTGVVLGDGTEIRCEVLVYATGYHNPYPFLGPEVMAQLMGPGNDRVPLYRHMIPPGVKNLAFVGAEVSTYNNILTSGLQAEWLASLLLGEVVLPDRSAMARDIARRHAWQRRVMPGLHNTSAVMLYQQAYHDQLMADMRLAARRKAHFLGECFHPYQADDYQDVAHQIQQRRAAATGNAASSIPAAATDTAGTQLPCAPSAHRSSSQESPDPCPTPDPDLDPASTPPQRPSSSSSRGLKGLPSLASILSISGSQKERPGRSSAPGGPDISEKECRRSLLEPRPHTQQDVGMGNIQQHLRSQRGVSAPLPALHSGRQRGPLAGAACSAARPARGHHGEAYEVSEDLAEVLLSAPLPAPLPSQPMPELQSIGVPGASSRLSGTGTPPPPAASSASGPATPQASQHRPQVQAMASTIVPADNKASCGGGGPAPPSPQRRGASKHSSNTVVPSGPPTPAPAAASSPYAQALASGLDDPANAAGGAVIGGPSSRLDSAAGSFSGFPHPQQHPCDVATAAAAARTQPAAAAPRGLAARVQAAFSSLRAKLSPATAKQRRQQSSARPGASIGSGVAGAAPNPGAGQAPGAACPPPTLPQDPEVAIADAMVREHLKQGVATGNRKGTPRNTHSGMILLPQPRGPVVAAGAPGPGVGRTRAAPPPQWKQRVSPFGRPGAGRPGPGTPRQSLDVNSMLAQTTPVLLLGPRPPSGTNGLVDAPASHHSAGPREESDRSRRTAGSQHQLYGGGGLVPAAEFGGGLGAPLTRLPIPELSAGAIAAAAPASAEDRPSFTASAHGVGPRSAGSGLPAAPHLGEVSLAPSKQGAAAGGIVGGLLQDPTLSNPMTGTSEEPGDPHPLSMNSLLNTTFSSLVPSTRNTSHAQAECLDTSNTQFSVDVAPAEQHGAGTDPLMDTHALAQLLYATGSNTNPNDDFIDSEGQLARHFGAAAASQPSPLRPGKPPSISDRGQHQRLRGSRTPCSADGALESAGDLPVEPVKAARNSRTSLDLDAAIQQHKAHLAHAASFTDTPGFAGGSAELLRKSLNVHGLSTRLSVPRGSPQQRHLETDPDIAFHTKPKALTGIDLLATCRFDIMSTNASGVSEEMWQEPAGGKFGGDLTKFLRSKPPTPGSTAAARPARDRPGKPGIKAESGSAGPPSARGGGGPSSLTLGNSPLSPADGSASSPASPATRGPRSGSRRVSSGNGKETAARGLSSGHGTIGGSKNSGPGRQDAPGSPQPQGRGSGNGSATPGENHHALPKRVASRLALQAQGNTERLVSDITKVINSNLAARRNSATGGSVHGATVIASGASYTGAGTASMHSPGAGGPISAAPAAAGTPQGLWGSGPLPMRNDLLQLPMRNDLLQLAPLDVASASGAAGGSWEGDAFRGLGGSGPLQPSGSAL